MGYHITILRTEGKKSIPITKDEVVSLVDSRDDLEIIRQSRKDIEITTKVLDHTGPLFIWQDGVIWSKTPDESTLDLMIQIGEKLNARVRGDELETYKCTKESYIHPDDKSAIEEEKKQLKIIKWRTKKINC